MPSVMKIENGQRVYAFSGHVDMFGNEMKIGDLVVHSGNGFGIVVKVCDVSVRVFEIPNIELDKEYEVQFVKEAPRWKMPAWSESMVVKCMNCTRRIVETLPTQDFVVEYTLPNGGKFYAKMNWQYKETDFQ
ncbi:hypothetical protein Aeh1ORF252c [Aeromonas phage Aeh1]|uniref:Uncharacterized protein n=1 Tax=Aeromonas phage Aeh1 TaxID=2880362 RepID=Q76YI1_9CAUD|nr:hypothetical protein Aeh1p264 [Aeromonas phage Aeh1]AAQ17914.1 hypothetical protein Aeh1ORF252c [Aeromonas phage Aeh1]